MATTRPQGARPLPTPPSVAAYYYQPPAANLEAAWYEHEERMRPSYIQPPQFHSPPPLSPSARWNPPPQQQQQREAASLPFPSDSYATPQQAAPTLNPKRSSGGLPHTSSGPSSPSYSGQKRPITMPGNCPLPEAHQQQGGRPRQTSLLPPADPRYAPGQYDPRNLYGYGAGADEGIGASRMNKGSAFVHKGFFDILSLVNDRSASPSRFVQQQQGSAPPSPSRLKATISKATGGLKKMAGNVSGNGGAGVTPPATEDSFLIPAAGVAPQRSRDSMQTIMAPGGARAASPATFSHVSGMQQTSMAGSFNPPASLGPASMGPRAQKKRISIDMVGAPQLGTFVHAAHASDADQAEEILRRWSRDGMGKIADPSWVAPIKQAMRVQQARNQAEAIAQVQAALHQDSLIRDNPRQFHIVNGNASNLTASTMTATTITAGTAGHGSTSTYHTVQSGAATRSVPDPFQGGIAEEIRGSDGEARDAPQPPLGPHVQAPASPYRAPASPSTPRKSPLPVPRPQAPGFPRSNTAGTMVIASTPELTALAAEDVPDYLQYRPAEPASGAAATGERPLSKAIDGLPSAAAGGINALFDAPAPASAPGRPASVVVRESALGGLENGDNGLSPVTALTGHMALAAGAAIRPSLTTVEKSVAAKIFFENLYYGILKKPRARDTRKAGLEAELAQLRIPESSKGAIRAAWAANETEYLRDLRARVNVNSFAKLKTIGHGAFGVVALCKERGTGELFAMKQLRKADMLRKGQEGHVRAERDLMTSASSSASAKWIVKLVYSFQDVDHLYLIMEFMGGGDLLNLLIEKDIFAEDFARFYVAEMVLAIHEAHRLGYIHRDIKPDNFLFTSEGHIKLADFGLCQSFHWAHDGAYYDQQRKNLLRKHGIDLEDSGRNIRAPGARRGGAGDASSKGRKAGATLNDKELGEVMADRNEDGTPLTHVLTWRDKNKKKIAYSVVGTNNYMAPEVLRGMGYDQSCDWWSLGVIVFEMLYGYPPFVSKSRHLTRQKILNWRQTLRFPPKPKVSKDAQDFISRLICEKDDRLGSTASASVSRPNSLLQGSRQRSGFMAPGSAATGGPGGLIDGVEDLMAHPWFRGVDWDRIHTQRAPFRPALSHPADTKHFEDDIEDEPLPAPGAAEAAKNGQPPPVDTPRDPMLRDKDHGEHLLEMRKQLAFVGYTFKSPKQFDAKAQLSESKIVAAERAALNTQQAREQAPQQQQRGQFLREPTDPGSRLRSMSM